MLFLSAKLGFYHNIHNILNMNMLIQCADLIFKQHDRKLQEPNVYHRVLQLEVNHGIILDYSPGDTYPNKSLSCDRHNPRCLVWHIPRYPQISPDLPSVHTFVTHALPANRMFSGFKSLAVNEWWNSESRHIPKLEMRHSRRFSVTNRTCRHKFPGSTYGS